MEFLTRPHGPPVSWSTPLRVWPLKAGTLQAKSTKNDRGALAASVERSFTVKLLPEDNESTEGLRKCLLRINNFRIKLLDVSTNEELATWALATITECVDDAGLSEN